MTRYMRLARRPSAGSSSTTTPRCGGGRPMTSRRSGPRCGSSSTSRPSYDEVLADRSMPGAQVVQRRRALLSRAHLPRPPGRPRGDPPRLRAARPGGVDVGRAARPDRARARRPAGDGHRARRPRRRLHAEHPRDDRRLLRDRVSLGAVWSSCSPDFGARSVVDRFAQIEPKVLLTVDGYRYGGKDHDRGELIEKRPGRDAVARAHGDARLPRPGRERLGRGVPGDRRGARVRPRPVRPPAVGPLLVGHHRPAEGDRALAGRDPARAPQEAPPPPRRPGGRPPVLVHHHGLDDVELPGRRAAHRRVDRALRRQPGHAGHGRAVGPRRADRHDHASAPAPPTSPPA